MVESLPFPKNTRALLFVAPALLLLALLPGCESESYSDSVVFRVRTDPLIKDPTDLPDGDRITPDRPGQLPLLSLGKVELEEIAYLLPGKDIGAKFMDPTRVREEDRIKLQDALESVFGIPAHPTVHLTGVEEEIKVLGLDKKTLAKGSRYYRQNCMPCHGVTGDGRGPTGQWVNPHPRDYREGLFKFQSVDQATDGQVHKPAREDLFRTLKNGIEGTAMPAFNMLSDGDLESLVSYVILLSIRGEVEVTIFRRDVKEDPKTKELRLTQVGNSVRELARDLVSQWAKDQKKEALINAAPYPDLKAEALQKSVRRGQAIFLGDLEALKREFPQVKDLNKLKAQCTSCHFDYGRQAKFKFDVWGTMVRPANLTAGVYRGGRRPIDIYWRIHSGINGSGMNKFGADLTGEQIWDVVNFVQALPYPQMRQAYGINITGE
jgi:mono/diheme cytochrome c family protein